MAASILRFSTTPTPPALAPAPAVGPGILLAHLSL